jgi:hypothetical protein
MLGRSFDITFATLMLALSFPLFLASSLGIRLSSRGKKIASHIGLARHAQTNSTPCDGDSSFDQAIAAYEELIDATVSGNAR